MDHSFAVTYLMRAQTSMSAPFPSGKLPTTRVRRLISRLSRSIMLFYSSRLSFSCGGVGKPPFSRAGRAGGLTCGATMARLGPRYGSGRLSLRATSSRVEGDGLAGTGAAPMVSVFCQVVIGQCGVSFPSEKAVGFSPVRNWPVIARVLLFHCIRA